MQRLTAIVHGRVQGVNFRYFTLQEARRLGLTGWVANRPDGTVEVVAEGPEDALASLERWLHRGSPAARVERVEVQWSPASGEFSRFQIRY
ncbi:acylphosphatase [Litorilinea aerophila]|uniref:Acylphosphatase n=1 Tax=Litorilinea aerophila TaxID=1204385 RepID=A0A540VH91_9CHLR|nr:acylphosphatase [Litorilinea aerophila]MCC9076181.1 acylphosphatase [Litorilinea aerophila]OUC06103.1 acylphosphatase [Litorilinea aerophila]GIV78881.1 MAG: acylphosphatase [Litorilinea sp.]